VDVSKAVEQRATPEVCSHQLDASHWYQINGLVKDQLWRAVRHYDINPWKVWYWIDGYVLNSFRAPRIEAIFVSFVWESPVTEFGLVRRRIYLYTHITSTV